MEDGTCGRLIIYDYRDVDNIPNIFGVYTKTVNCLVSNKRLYFPKMAGIVSHPIKCCYIVNVMTSHQEVGCMSSLVGYRWLVT